MRIRAGRSNIHNESGELTLKSLISPIQVLCLCCPFSLTTHLERAGFKGVTYCWVFNKMLLYLHWPLFSTVCSSRPAAPGPGWFWRAWRLPEDRLSGSLQLQSVLRWQTEQSVISKTLNSIKLTKRHWLSAQPDVWQHGILIYNRTDFKHIKNIKIRFNVGILLSFRQAKFKQLHAEYREATPHVILTIVF